MLLLISILQVYFLRAIFNLHSRANVNELYVKYGIMNVSNLYKLQIACLFHRQHSGHIPIHLKFQLPKVSNIHEHDTRQSDRLYIANASLKMQQNIPWFDGFKICYSILSDIKSCKTNKLFRSQMKAHLLSSAHTWATN